MNRMLDLMKVFSAAEKGGRGVVLEIMDSKKTQVRKHICKNEDLTKEANRIFIKYNVDLTHKELPGIRIIDFYLQAKDEEDGKQGI